MKVMTHPQVWLELYVHPQVFDLETHPFWPHIPNMTQYWSAPWAGSNLTQTLLIPLKVVWQWLRFYGMPVSAEKW